MANPGVGNKFVPVNLNKSYGQSTNPKLSNSSHGSGRARSGVHGGGSMVVLSRPKSSHKPAPKLSVPPPLNLPSLRKEHERFDPLGSGTGSVGGVGSGSGARPASSGTGWSKPSSIPLVERNAVDGGGRPLSSEGMGLRGQIPDGAAKGSTSAVYMPPSAKFVSSSPDVPPLVQLAGKASVLRGEDFPSLKATLTGTSGPSQRQKDGLNQKLRQGPGEEIPSGLRDGSHFSSNNGMRPQVQSSQQSLAKCVAGSISDHRGLDSSRQPEQARKQDAHFAAPLPLVQVNPRSDWADDERDTSHGFMDRSRDYVSSNAELYWDRDFDLPRSSILRVKPAQNLFDRRAQQDNGIGKYMSNEVPVADPYNRDVRIPSRAGHEGNSWRSSVSTQDTPSERNVAGPRGNGMLRDQEMDKESKYAPPQFGVNARDNYNGGTGAGRENLYGERDAGCGQGGRQSWNNVAESSNGRGGERSRRDRYGSESSRYKVDTVQRSLVSKSSFSTSGKGPSLNDPLLNFGREKRALTSREKPYVEDPFMKEWESSGFDGRDAFSRVIGVVKRKKDVNKQVDFHDPVRESFEAELERVQKMQEQERQRILEEQERVLEVAQREEEERQRHAREQEERQRQLEEEAREAAWRTEHERLEAMQRAEEQRIAREEEKRRMMMEEERRKQAAKQKLLELEERMARRQVQSASTDSTSTVLEEKMHGTGKERDHSRTEDLVSWEDSERMVESITNSTCTDSSGLDRSFDVGSRVQLPRDRSFAFADRGRPQNRWRRDVFENGNNSSFLPFNQENGHLSLGQDAFVGGKAYPRKELYGSSGFMPPRGYFRGGIPEPMADFAHAKGRRWNMSGDGDFYGRITELDSEFHDNIADRFADISWGSSRSSGILNSPYPERVYHNTDSDELYSYGRSRYPARQPHVLPPPLVASMHRTAFMDEKERAGSTFDDDNMQFNNEPRSELTAHSHENVHREKQEHSAMFDVQDGSNKINSSNLYRNSPRCDSQSSLSVSSPPSSPTHLSHDDLDESGDCSLALAEGNKATLSGNEAVISSTRSGKETMTAPSAISVGDDDEWAVENNDDAQAQEEYDEDEDGYRGEDEVHQGNDELDSMSREFEEMHLEGEDSASMVENLVLGFDQGVEVGIPNDECERSLRNDGASYVVPQVSAGFVEEHKVLDGNQDNGQNSQFADGSPHEITDISGTVLDNRCTVKDLVTQSNNAPQSLVQADLLSSTETSSGSALSSQQPSASSADPCFHSSSQPIISTVSSAQGEGVLPVKLQFGLFSGPSLIPSPVPAIQIGSIQMPLHLHPQVGPSPTHVHSPQPPIFQFGQLRYPPPMAQGILPLAPQSMSFIQPKLPTSYPLHQKPGSILSACRNQNDIAQSCGKNDFLSLSVNNLSINPPTLSSTTPSIVTTDANLSPEGQGTESSDLFSLRRAGFSGTSEILIRPESASRVDGDAHPHISSSMSSSGNKSSGQINPRPSSLQSTSSVKDSSSLIADGQFQVGAGRKFAFTARNTGPKLSSSATQGSCHDLNRFYRRARRGTQRMEFRVRESADKRQSSASASCNQSMLDVKSPYVGRNGGMSQRNGLKKEVGSDRPKNIGRSENLGSGQFKSQEPVPKIQVDNGSRKDALTHGSGTSWHGEGSLKRNISPEDDVDAPLQSGVVRVFKQPGIEAPSDEDNFIEVRSKRQMLNDRREQREKEIKAKSNNVKKASSRKPCSSAQASMVTRVTAKTSILACGGEATNTVLVDNALKWAMEKEVSAGLDILPQQLAPIGTPAANADTQGDARLRTTKLPHSSSIPVASLPSETGAIGVTFESKHKFDNAVQTSLSTWGNARINQQVMTSTQSQPDEALKPGRFDKHPSVGNSVGGKSSSSILEKDMSFSSASSTLNSLLAGEKIQFGAVTSPTVLPPSNRTVTNSIGPPSRSDLVQQNRSPIHGDCALLFEKEKQSDESSLNLVDCEAEAEAAASAVAAAAISNDDAIGNGPSTSTEAMTDCKSFGGDDVNGIAGTSGDQQAVSHSKTEETLSVSLPADLSVDNLSVSLWSSLSSPLGSSSQMLSPFSGGTPSHFPYYDVNPMLGGPIFAFGPHDESSGNQPPQKNNSSGSVPVGAWQPTGADKFYAPPAHFAAPFINPPGGIPGVQAPPHMVVYNHFPVGQFGQVGLSYMGAAYIPSGKQPDWKHNPTSVPIGVGEGEMNNLNMASTLHNRPNASALVQHHAPGSPLLPMASPSAMFDASIIQSSADMSAAQARWPHVPASPLHSIPVSMPRPWQQQPEPVVPHQLTQGLAVTQAHNTNRLPNSQMPASGTENGHNFPVSRSAAANPNAEELRLVETPSSTGPEDSNKNAENKDNLAGGRSGATEARRPLDAQDGAGSRSNQQQQQGIKVQTSSHQRNLSNNHGFHRGGGGASQKNGSGTEWPSNRMMGSHARNNSRGAAERGYPPTKMKQIYVAKQSSSGGSTT